MKGLNLLGESDFFSIYLIHFSSLEKKGGDINVFLFLSLSLSSFLLSPFSFLRENNAKMKQKLSGKDTEIFVECFFFFFQ